MYRQQFLKPVLLLLSLLSAGLLLASCDHLVSVEGTVYEAPANGIVSGVFVTTDTATVQGLSALKDVEITMESPKLDRTTTDTKGSFRVGCATGSEPEEARFTVSKPGYETVVGKVRSRSHCAIFLRPVPEKKK
jgi:hypothetical protein